MKSGNDLIEPNLNSSSLNLSAANPESVGANGIPSPFLPQQPDFSQGGGFQRPTQIGNVPLPGDFMCITCHRGPPYTKKYAKN